MILTISRAYGAAGLPVAQAAADALGYRLVDEQLPVVAAWRLGTSTEIVETLADRPRPFGERFLEQLGGGVPETAQPAAPDDDFSAETRRAIEQAVRDEAAAGDAVIVGRMASAVLAERSDLVRAFLQAPLAWRIAHVAASLGIAEAAARSEIARIDEARRTYAREGYRVAWGDPRHYDLVLDTSRFDAGGAAAILAAAVRAAESGPSARPTGAG